MTSGKKRVPQELLDKLAYHEERVEIYAEAMLTGDFEENRVKWAAELVRVAKLQEEIGILTRVNHSPREGNYLSI